MSTPTPDPRPPTPPASTIGILGGGQLGRMLAIAAAQMGYHAHIYCPEADCPAAEVARETTVAEYTDLGALTQFARRVDVITYEFENIPTTALRALSEGAPIRPGVALLETCQHRLREKTALNGLRIATAPFRRVAGAEDLAHAVGELGTPCILKTAELGYDGKGQVKLTGGEDAKEIWQSLSTREAILEGFVDFTMELSVIVARNAAGEMRCYPPVHNVHKHHILHTTTYPAPIAPDLAREAERMARAIAEGLELTGILAVELFVTRDGLLVNELAPRPHNSGHWTLDACTASQFEQTLRAVCGLPLADTTPLCPAVMTNLIGDEAGDWPRHYQNPRARVHLYGKAEARAGRKMGHVTVLG